ncbi:MAG: Acetyltransferase Pat [Syntrophus sp. PtaB.Bin001]|nr:MAG: Acetyltransferase Pat [Syntrophus sp. PtaB.Bin001]
MEEVGNARKFMSAARAFALRKPIVILKPGRFAESAMTAMPDSTPTAGSDAIYDAAFKRAGVIRVKDIAGLFHAAGVLDSRKLPKGPRLAIVTAAGLEFASAGPGLMATDALIDLGGEPARLSPETIETLKNTLPPHWSEGNPVDVLGDKDTAGYVKAIDACLQDPGVDGVLVIYVPMNIAGPEEVAKAVIGSARKTWKPIIAAWIGGRQVRNAREILIQNNIPTYETPEDAVRTYIDMFKYKRNLDLLHETPSELPDRKSPLKQPLKKMIDKAVREGRTILSETEAEELLLSYDIPATFQETQKMMKEVDYELILGSQRDKDFGSIIFFGMGGTAADFVRDFSIGLPPLNQTLARRLMEETKAFNLIQGYRGKPPANTEELEKILVNFSNLIVDFPEIAEIVINKLVISNGSPYVLDARIILETRSFDSRSQYPHLVIAPYPVRLIENWKFTDGHEVLLRPIKPEDEPLAREFLSSLSPETLRTRFFSSITNINHEWLVLFCDTDYDRHLSIVAETTECGRRRIIGVGTLHVDAEKSSGEFALIVHDSFQRKGLASKLMQLIIAHGRERGLDEINGQILNENDKMLSLAKKLGFKRQWQQGGIISVILRLK